MLINCVAYQDGNKLSDISIEQISDYLKRPDCFVWVALKDAEPAELAKMQEEFGLHELAVEDALNGHQRPKVEEYGDSLFAVVKTAEMVNGTLHVGELDIFVGDNYILSVRNRSAQGFLGVRARCEREPQQLRKGSAFVLYALMDAVVDRYFPVMEALENELELIEGKIFEKGLARTNIERLRPEARDRHAEAHRRSVDGSGRQTVRRPCAESVRKHARLLPRHRRSSVPYQCDDRCDPRHDRHRHSGEPVNGHD